MAALQSSPQLQQLREVLQQNPALIQPIIQQLAASNPQLGQLIQQNPEALLQLLGGGGGEGDDDGPAPPGSHVVHVTEEERAAIERVSQYLNIRNNSKTHPVGGSRIPASGCIRGLLCVR